MLSLQLFPCNEDSKMEIKMEIASLQTDIRTFENIKNHKEEMQNNKVTEMRR